jgi:hypothetical protein
MLPLFAIVSVPIVAQAFSGWLKEDFPKNRIWTIETNLNSTNQTSNGWIWMVTVIIAVVLLFKLNIPIDVTGKGNAFSPQFFPVEAVSWLESNPQSGHVFNEFDWGGYMLLNLWPQYPIFMDGHTHIYGEKLTREYEQVITLSNNWESILDKYQITWAIVRAQSSIAKALENNGWDILYQDKTTVILRHQ